MIILNVLPPSLKEEFEVNRMKSVVLSMLIITGFCVVGTIVAMLSSYWVENMFNDLMDQSTFALESNAEILDFNRMVENIEFVQKDYYKSSEYLTVIFNAIPQGVRVTEVTLKGDHRVISIKGETEEKDLIFKTKDNFAELEGFSGVELVTDELIAKTRKSFTISLKLK